MKLRQAIEQCEGGIKAYFALLAIHIITMWISIICLLSLLGLLLFIKDTVKNHKNKSNYYFSNYGIDDSTGGCDSTWGFSNGDYAVGYCNSSDSGSCDGDGGDGDGD